MIDEDKLSESVISMDTVLGTPPKRTSSYWNGCGK